MSDFTWAEDVVRGGLGGLKRLSGYYHENFVAQHDGQDYLIRIPRAQADDMDLRMFDENDVLRLLNQHDYPTPKLVYYSQQNDFAVQEFIHGPVLSELYPKGQVLSNGVLEQIAVCFAKLHTVDSGPLLVHAQRPVVASNKDFYNALVDYVAALYKRLWTEIPEVYSGREFPADPVLALRRFAPALSDAPVVLCHADLHQHNIIVRSPDNQLWPIDWELAQIAPAAFDLSCHINRGHLTPEQHHHLVGQYLELCPNLDDADFRQDVSAYLAVEVIKSAIVDTHRLHHATSFQSIAHQNDYTHNVRYPAVMRAAQEIWNGTI